MTKAERRIAAIVLVAIAVSIVHYTDNYTAYEAYPQSDTIPNPSAGVIGGAWFFFTAFGLAGLYLLWQGRRVAAGISLAVYSGSGLVGIGHYAVGGTGDFPWWRHAHIAADILLGIAVFASALYLVRRPREPVTPEGAGSSA